jgi:predicted TIM-barrel fold metal-dependent hydrolase
VSVRAIDLWVNANMGPADSAPDFLQAVNRDYFKRDEGDFFHVAGIDELLETMDRTGVEKALLTTSAHRPDEVTLSFAKRRPDRFALACQLDPSKPMKAVRALERFHGEYGPVLARITPFAIDVPPSHAIYYPVYTRCIDLGLPISINTGIPGPPMPGECQHPMHLDRVCLHFPELVLVMAHGADPWWGEACRLMLKYPNLYLMTSAYLPKYLPPDFLHFMNTRGRHKVMYASDHPVIAMDRCLEEARKLDLRPGVLEAWLYDNAERVLFGGGSGAG